MKYLSIVLVTVFGLAVALFTFWEYQPTDVIDIKTPISVNPPVARSEDPIVLTITYCKNSSVSGTVRTSFVGQSIEILQPTATDSQSKGCHKDLKVPVLLPPSTTVPPGKYNIKFHAVYQVNPVKTDTKDFSTEEFEIR